MEDYDESEESCSLFFMQRRHKEDGRACFRMWQERICLRFVPRCLIPRQTWTGWTKKSRSTVEMNDPSSRPAIVDKVEHMEQYDTVYGIPDLVVRCADDY